MKGDLHEDVKTISFFHINTCFLVDRMAPSRKRYVHSMSVDVELTKITTGTSHKGETK
jgi:hypothetical protein